MTFFEVFCSNVWSMGLAVVFYVCAAIQLLGKIPYRNRRHPYTVFGSLMLFILFTALLGAAFYKTGMFHLKYNIGQTVFQYIELFEGMLILRVMYQKPYGRCLVTAAFLEILDDFAWNLQELFMPDKFYHLEILAERREYMFHQWVVIPFAMFLVLVFLNKTKADVLYAQWENRSLQSGILIFMGLYPILIRVMYTVVRLNERSGGYNPITSIIFVMVIYLIFIYAGREELQKKQIEEQNVSLQQHEAYIENLESLQREVRRFRHDFKNMMAGMYLQAKEGDLDAVQSYIQEMTADFDTQVGSQIRVMNQLANIRVAEVKGLFLEKLNAMQKEEIHCELEVLRPFEKAVLRCTDLCRCLGILLDNAMDEVRGRKDGQIHVMISSQNGCTTFRVKNTLYSKIDFHKLGTAGYSTKGDSRGIGLANYKKILERYDMALPLTTIEDGCFIQELKVQEP